MQTLAHTQAKSYLLTLNTKSHLDLAEGVPGLPLHQPQVTPAPADEQVAPAAAEVQVVGSQALEAQVKGLSRCAGLCLLQQSFLQQGSGSQVGASARARASNLQV